jgi:hypothetical protein
MKVRLTRFLFAGAYLALSACAAAVEPGPHGEVREDEEIDSVSGALGPAVWLGAIATEITNNNNCLDVIGASTSPGAGVQTYGCHHGNNQKWYYNGTNSTLRDVNSGMCLIPGGTADGSRVQMQPCDGTLQQAWWWNPDGTLEGAPGKCLDITGGAAAPGIALQLWSCHGQANQVFARSPTIVRNAASGRCLDVRTQDGTTIQLWDCHGGANQSWTQNGELYFQNGMNGTFMRVIAHSGGSGAPNWPVRSDPTPEVSHAKFTFRTDGSIGHMVPGWSLDWLCLDAADPSQPNGSGVIVAACNGSVSQVWLTN